MSAIVAAGVVPRCLEMLDAATLDAVRAAGVAVDPRAGAMLLVEVDGDGAGDDAAARRRGRDGVRRVHRRRRRRRTRRSAIACGPRGGCSRRPRASSRRHKLSEDVVVPRTRIADLLARTDDIGDATGVRHLAYGHAGDGNLHVNFLWNDDAERPAVDRAIAMLMRATIDLGGTLSGEHGIGVSKAEYLPLEQSEALIALQRDVKRAFDPQGPAQPGEDLPERRPPSLLRARALTTSKVPRTPSVIHWWDDWLAMSPENDCVAPPPVADSFSVWKMPEVISRYGPKANPLGRRRSTPSIRSPKFQPSKVCDKLAKPEGFVSLDAAVFGLDLDEAAGLLADDAPLQDGAVDEVDFVLRSMRGDRDGRSQQEAHEGGDDFHGTAPPVPLSAAAGRGCVLGRGNLRGVFRPRAAGRRFRPRGAPSP